MQINTDLALAMAPRTAPDICTRRLIGSKYYPMFQYMDGMEVFWMVGLIYAVFFVLVASPNFRNFRRDKSEPFDRKKGPNLDFAGEKLALGIS
jgi:hypothetical protein